MSVSLPNLLAVAAGGALGSVGRYLTMSLVAGWFGTGFPISTLSVNVLGSFIMGVLVETWAVWWSADMLWRSLLAVGVLGGFTTFSTFSLDMVVLLERGESGAAALYAGASVILSVLGLFAGLLLIRSAMA